MERVSTAGRMPFFQVALQKLMMFRRRESAIVPGLIAKDCIKTKVVYLLPASAISVMTRTIPFRGFSGSNRVVLLVSGILALSLAKVSATNPALPAINTNNIVNITNAPYNAVSGGVITNTAAIQSAINAAAAGGTTNGLAGGTVEIPPGVFLSGSLGLKSKVNLQLDAGATLLFLPESSYPNATGNPDYPIGATNLTDVEISGTGTIDGNGAGWWSANPPNRPYMIFFTKCQRVLIQNVTLQNPPKMHIVFKNSGCGNIMIQGITINTISTSPNTDGIDLVGTNCLIQNCFISGGDDNIALGSSSSGTFTSDVLVTNCAFGFGHGVSLGSNTQGGVSNLTVINCTFNGTQYGIRMKSDDNTSGGSGQGGVSQNLFYYNLGMTNITRAPIVIYSYYSEFGTPIGITPATAAAQAVGTNIYPIWRNIVISNLTATVFGTGNAGVIWGRIETPATNILMSHVSITASNTFDVYNAYGIQFADSQINTMNGNKTLTLFNAGVTVSNNTGGTITVDGLTSTNALALYNSQASMTANDAFGANPITLGGGTLTINNALSLPGASTVNFALGSNTSEVISTGSLSLNSTLNITNAAGFGPGTYTLFSYRGSLSGTPVLGTTPVGFPYVYSLNPSTPGQVNFVVSSPTPPAPPVFQQVGVSGGNLVMSGTGGTTNGNYYVLTSTNLVLPLSQWTFLATNTFDGSGNFTFTDTNGIVLPQRFYRLLLP
jgi:polygalacturonase